MCASFSVDLPAPRCDAVQDAYALADDLAIALALQEGFSPAHTPRAEWHPAASSEVAEALGALRVEDLQELVTAHGLRHEGCTEKRRLIELAARAISEPVASAMPTDTADDAALAWLLAEELNGSVRDGAGGSSFGQPRGGRGHRADAGYGTTAMPDGDGAYAPAVPAAGGSAALRDRPWQPQGCPRCGEVVPWLSGKDALGRRWHTQCLVCGMYAPPARPGKRRATLWAMLRNGIGAVLADAPVGLAAHRSSLWATRSFTPHAPRLRACG